MIKFSESVYHAKEFVLGQILVSMWDSGFLVIEKKTGQCIQQIKDSIPANVNCRGFMRFPGFHSDNFPYVVSRSAMTMQIVNLKTGFCQEIISDTCDANWY